MNVVTRNRISRKLLLTALLVVLSLAAGSAQAGFVRKVFSDADGRHAYQVFLPENYSARKQWPVILFLHGTAERGRDGVRPTTVGLGPMIRRHPERFPFIAVFPQAESLDSRILNTWSADQPDAKRALKILRQVESQYSVDSARRILSGWSAGGHGVWSLAAAKSKLWAGLVPLSGGGNTELAPKVADIPAWAFHGERDPLVAVESTQKMVRETHAAGGNARFTLVKGIGHASWKVAFDNPRLLAWMQNPAGDHEIPEVIVATEAQKSIRPDDHLVPFVPAVEVSRAVTVRLGNKALKAISYSVPEMVPRSMLSGRLGDILDSKVTEGRRFNVRFSGISYSAQLARVRLRGNGENSFRIQLGLRNVTLSIRRTYVRGRSRSAVAGPMYVVIGHRRPVWLTIDIRPFVADRTIRLKTRASYFRIPGNNWYVTAPRGVSTEGLGMTEERVSRGLVSGIYSGKGRIERQVRSLVPRIVRQMEGQLKIPDASDVVSDVWPLPFYAPRARLFPESIRTDDNGVTVTLGLTAAAIHPEQAPASPRRVQATQRLSVNWQNGENVHIAVAQDLLKPLTQLMIDARVARIDVRDLPEKAFARLADVETMSRVFPDLQRLGPQAKLRTEVILRQPLVMTPPDGESVSAREDERTAMLHVPDLALALSVKREDRSKGQHSKWTPYAELSLDLSQLVHVRLQHRGFTKRLLTMNFPAKPQIQLKGRFAPTSNPSNAEIHPDRVRDVILQGWASWLERGGAHTTPIPDLEFGQSALRISQIDLSNSHISATFTEPGTKITNSSQQPLRYEVKGPYSPWGGPYTLPPGESHTFEVPYNIIYRRRADRNEVRYTLPAGFHAEYRATKDGSEPRLLRAE